MQEIQRKKHSTTCSGYFAAVYGADAVSPVHGCTIRSSLHLLWNFFTEENLT